MVDGEGLGSLVILESTELEGTLKAIKMRVGTLADDLALEASCLAVGGNSGVHTLDGLFDLKICLAVEVLRLNVARSISVVTLDEH